MSEMVERVARALWEVGGSQPWGMAIEAAREHMRKLARVAIDETRRTLPIPAPQPPSERFDPGTGSTGEA